MLFCFLWAAAATMDVVEMVLGGRVNKSLVSLIQQASRGWAGAGPSRGQLKQLLGSCHQCQLCCENPASLASPKTLDACAGAESHE